MMGLDGLMKGTCGMMAEDWRNMEKRREKEDIWQRWAKGEAKPKDNCSENVPYEAQPNSNKHLKFH